MAWLRAQITATCGIPQQYQRVITTSMQISDGLNEAKAYSAQPLTIDHDHGLVMDCSSVLNDYGGRFNALTIAIGVL